MTVTIITADGCSPRTASVELSNAESHIAARDQFATESLILLSYSKCEECGEFDPIAWKHADPTEGAYFLFHESDVAAIESEDPGLIVRVEVIDDKEASEQRIQRVADGILDSAASEYFDTNTANWEAVEAYASNGCGIELTRSECEKVLAEIQQTQRR